MRPLRTLSGRSLAMVLVAAVAIVIGGTVAAVAARSGSTADTPPAEPLANALHDALAAPPPAGVTARVTFTNNLFPSGALFGNAGSALLSGASGRLWLTNDGRGRIELQSDSGDVQVVWSPTRVSVFDASSNTVYRMSLPASNDKAQQHAAPTVARISDALTQLARHLDVSGATPTAAAGRPAYEASVAPKDAGSLLGSLRVAWDAEQGVPLRVGLYAKGSAAPALQLAVKSITYGSVSSSDVDIAPPPGAKVVGIGAPSGQHDSSRPMPVTGLDAVKAAAGFGVVAPDTLSGRSLAHARLVGKRVVLVYGKGPGAIVLVERKADTASAGGLQKVLPPVALNGATGHELSTELGTAIVWQRDGVAFVLLGSVPSATAESAARAVA